MVDKSVRVELAALNGRKGSYILILPCNLDMQVEIGALGSLYLKPGSYAYVGSALGPGGLGRRLGRHLKTPRQLHWHIDYLLVHLKVSMFYYLISPKRFEHEIAQLLEAASEIVIPLRGFGSSDCRCRTHLFHFRRPLQVSSLESTLRQTPKFGHLKRVWPANIGPRELE